MLPRRGEGAAGKSGAAATGAEAGSGCRKMGFGDAATSGKSARLDRLFSITRFDFSSSEMVSGTKTMLPRLEIRQRP